MKSSLTLLAPASCQITGAKPAGGKPAGFLRRLYEAFWQSQQGRVERDIARLLDQSDGCLTDEIERRMTQQLIGNHGFRS